MGNLALIRIKMKKLIVLTCLLLCSCGGVEIGNDGSSSSDDHSISTDNSRTGIFTCSYTCEPVDGTDDTEGFSESFEYEGGENDCLELVTSLGENCMVVDEELPVIEGIIVPEETPENTTPGFNF
jgi:hypothetical protein